MKLLKKLTSIKTLVTIWALALISYIVFTGKAEFLQLATLLCTVPLAYIPCNVLQDKIFSNNTKE